MVIPTLASISTVSLTERLFNRRDQIPSRADVLWRLKRGVVRTQTWSEEGSLISLGYWGPGDVVGGALSRLLPYKIECLTTVEMIILPSGLWSEALDAVVSHIQQTEQLLGIVHRNPIQQRLWYFLVWLGEKFGRDLEQGRLIDLQLTHQEIAETINTTRVTVLRFLQQFESEGRLRRHKRQLVLCQH